MERPARAKKKVVGLIGVGLDNQDGHKRVTRCQDILLVGGSADTHGRMQDVAIHFSEALKERGKRLADASPEEVIDLLHESHEK